MEGLVADLVHVLRSGGPLGVDVKHEKAVVPVPLGDALHRLQGVVQIPRGCGGWVDANADERVLSPGAQQVPVLGVVVGDIVPLVPVVVVPGGDQSLLEGQDLQLLGLAGWDMHGGTPPRTGPGQNLTQGLAFLVSFLYSIVAYYIAYHIFPRLSRA